MAINPCKDCGGEMRLSAMRITVNRKRGVTNSIEHMQNRECKSSESFSCVMIKPYKKPYPCDEMIQRWDTENPIPV